MFRNFACFCWSRWLRAGAFVAWACMAVVLLGAGPARAAELPAVQLSDASPQVALAGRSQFLIDLGGRLTADDIEARQDSLPFEVRQAGVAVELEKGDAMWVRFAAVVPDHRALWRLDVDLPGVDSAELYYRDAQGQWVVQYAGDQLAQSRWPQPGRSPLMALDTQTGVAITYFLRIRHDRVPFSGQLSLKTQTLSGQQEQRAQFFLGAYFGLASLAILVALINAIGYRDRSFAAYVVYILAMALGQAGITGIGGMLLWPEMPGLNNPVTFLMPMVAGAMGVWVVRIVVAPRQYARWLDALAVGAIALLMVVAGFDAMVPSAIGFNISMYLLALAMALVMGLLVMAIARGDRNSRWVAAGFGLIVLGGMFPLMRNFGWISSGFLSEYGLMLGSALEMPVLFYGLSRRLNEHNESRARARALAVTDPLTGTDSQRRMLRRLDDALVRARAGNPVALIVAELANHADLLGDYGREGADRALVLAAAMLKAVVRDNDFVARVGDRHFALLLESPCTAEEANAIATHAVARGLRSRPAMPGGETLNFHLVVGMLPLGAPDAQTLIQRFMQELLDYGPDARKTIRMLRT